MPCTMIALKNTQHKTLIDFYDKTGETLAGLACFIQHGSGGAYAVTIPAWRNTFSMHFKILCFPGLQVLLLTLILPAEFREAYKIYSILFTTPVWWV